jgi:hypothetical protein
MVTDCELVNVPGEGENTAGPAGGAITVPVTAIACWVPGTFNVLVVSITFSLSGDDELSGVKLIVNVQVFVLASNLVEVQSLVALLFSGKSAGKLIAENFNWELP